MADQDEGEEHGLEEWPADEGEVICPHCGASVQIALDPTGGTTQQYIEDCEVCCRPWLVEVRYTGGSVKVSVEAA